MIRMTNILRQPIGHILLIPLSKFKILFYKFRVFCAHTRLQLSENLRRKLFGSYHSIRRQPPAVPPWRRIQINIYPHPRAAARKHTLITTRATKHCTKKVKHIFLTRSKYKISTVSLFSPLYYIMVPQFDPPPDNILKLCVRTCIYRMIHLTDYTHYLEKN